jgi:alkylation response protein AidB-like acyl-CoA dehydrogenase
MGLQTTAVRSEDGKEWIINGKWNEVNLERPSFKIFIRVEEMDH